MELQLNLYEAKVNENRETFFNATIDNTKVAETSVQKASDTKKDILLEASSNLENNLYNFEWIKHPIFQMR